MRHCSLIFIGVFFILMDGNVTSNDLSQLIEHFAINFLIIFVFFVFFFIYFALIDQ